jgi:hypothetical protein
VVRAGWLGVEGDDTKETGAAGVAGPFRSRITKRTGEVTFCVTSIEKDGYSYMKPKNDITCIFVER